ncbi:hypothetical protein AVEN_104412-1 [Araneus ventricosus]|uniref:Uncharacterized protein n=1 Tax=Araneus ventricosus TaxID=182803 RepID=A0A4Y2N2U7_ARAVE|nr:hypothetical protein AVEN_104412-1 [Araneus ventricosus]
MRRELGLHRLQSKRKTIYSISQSEAKKSHDSHIFNKLKLGWPSGTVSSLVSDICGFKPRTRGKTDVLNGLRHAKSIGCHTSSSISGVEVCRRGFLLRCRPHHQTTVQNYKVRLRVVSFFFKAGLDLTNLN